MVTRPSGGKRRIVRACENLDYFSRRNKALLPFATIGYAMIEQPRANCRLVDPDCGETHTAPNKTNPGTSDADPPSLSANHILAPPVKWVELSFFPVPFLFTKTCNKIPFVTAKPESCFNLESDLFCMENIPDLKLEKCPLLERKIKW